SVISRKALLGELEKFTVREKPLSVLANQIVGFVISGNVNIKDAYSVIKRAYPFRGLSEEELERVILQLEQVRLIRREGEILRKGRRSLQYFFENVSMIPDEKTYKIIDIVTRRFVGTLDESFVVSYAQEGAKFISWGRSWQVVEIVDDTVRVTQSDDIGAVPSWLGEEIPVPYSVAQEVGKMRGYIERQIKGNIKKEDTIAELRKYYPTDEHAFEMFYDYIKKHAEKYPVPTDSRITVEHSKDLIIINACFGSKVNETIGRALSALIASKYGFTVGLQVDAYRIILEVPFFISRGEICDMLKSIQPESLHLLLKIILKNSSYLKYQLYHVGRKFGAIEKGADFNILSIPKLLDSFQNTPIYDEATEKVIWEKMDVVRASEVLERIRLGKIEIVPSDISVIGLEGVERSKELMRPEKADKSILQALKVRLEKENVMLACFACKRTWRSSVGELPNKIKCIFCDAVLVAAISPIEEEIKILKIPKNKNINEIDKKKLKKMILNAQLVASHGKKAVMALMARGIGPDTAARILQRPHQNEDEFLRDILAAEINYAKTRQFWR
ncbi:MAG: helicase, partial [Thermoplasmata archaeon]